MGTLAFLTYRSVITLYKNCELCNTFFRTKIDGFQYYKNVFSNPKNSVFDEFLHKGLSDMWKQLHPSLLWNEKPFDDIQVPRLSFNFISEFNPKVSNKLIFEYSDKNPDKDASFRAMAGKYSFISKFLITHGASSLYGICETKAAANFRLLNPASLPE